MISMFRKEACSGSIIHGLAHIPTQICLADCLTKASAKADNVITEVKTRKSLDVDIHPNFTTPMEHKVFLSSWCRTLMHTREKDVFFLNALRISFAPTPRKGPSHVMFVRTHTYFENQDATKITSALADSRIYSSWTMVSFLVKTLCLCLVLYPFSQCFTFFSQLRDHVIIKTDWCWQSKQMDTEFC